MNFGLADVKVMAWDKGEIEIQGTVDINDGANDENFIIDVEDTASEIAIKAYVKDKDQLPKVTVVKQGSTTTFIKHKSGKSNWRDYTDRDYSNASIWTEGVPVDVNLEIYIPRNVKLSIFSKFGDVTVENITNEIMVENKHGRLCAVFNKTPINQPVRLKSKHNVVDVSLPASAKMDVNLKSDHGNIYSDMDIDRGVKSGKMYSISPKVIKGTLNGGGTLLDLESTHNTIYLRKKE